MKSLFKPKEVRLTLASVREVEQMKDDHLGRMALAQAKSEPVVPTTPVRHPVPVSATVDLNTKLQRAITMYEQRAEQLQKDIDAATSERVDLLKARDAARLALDALVTDVLEAAIEEEVAARLG